MPRLVFASLMLVLCAGGATSLVYQVVWQRLLTIHYGVGAVSITIIVSVFMFGLGSGSVLGGVLSERSARPLRIYALLQLFMGAYGLTSHWLLKWLGQSTAGADPLVMGALSAVFLVPPTLAMGATLPLVTKLVNRGEGRLLTSLSWCYFANTLGAAFGAFAGSYLLVTLVGLDRALYVAAGLDLLLAVAVFVLARVRRRPAAATTELPAMPGISLGRAVYPLVFATGFLAIGYELVWIRALGVLVKQSPYAFPSILTVYLLGIAIGSLWMARRSPHLPADTLRSRFFQLQVALAVCAVGAFVALHGLSVFEPIEKAIAGSFTLEQHPQWGSPQRWLPGSSTLFHTFDVFLWPAFLMFVPCLLMGASLPLITQIAQGRSSRDGETVGFVYATNIFGNTIGGVATGFVLLPLLGTVGTIALFGATGLLFGLGIDRAGRRTIPTTWRTVGIGAAITLTIVMLPSSEAFYLKLHAPGAPENGRGHYEEGVEGVVVSYYVETEFLDFVHFINGLQNGSRSEFDYQHIAARALSAARPRSRVLLFGFGAGAIAETVLLDPEVEEVVIVEVVGTLIRAQRKHPFYERLFGDPRVSLVIDDGRRYLTRNETEFDLILADPLRVTTAYSNNVYSRESLSLLRDRLTDRGVLMIKNTNQTMLRTATAAFPHVRRYPFIVLASKAPIEVDAGVYEEVLRQLPVTIRDGVEGLPERPYRDFTEGDLHPGRINTDWRPNTEYYLRRLWQREESSR